MGNERMGLPVEHCRICRGFFNMHDAMWQTVYGLMQVASQVHATNASTVSGGGEAGMLAGAIASLAGLPSNTGRRAPYTSHLCDTRLMKQRQ